LDEQNRQKYAIFSAKDLFSMTSGCRKLQCLGTDEAGEGGGLQQGSVDGWGEGRCDDKRSSCRVDSGRDARGGALRPTYSSTKACVKGSNSKKKLVVKDNKAGSS
jgi:hypothetical protein